jgi:Galactose oxidase, central domain
MARFLQPSSSKSASPKRTHSSRFQSSHLDPPSPAGSAEPKTPASVHDQSHGPISGFLGFWANRSNSYVLEANSRKNSPSDELPVKPSGYSVPESSAQGHIHSLRPAASFRRPRHVPIIIPDFANPLAPKKRRRSSARRPSGSSNSSTPHLNRGDRTTSLDAQSQPSNLSSRPLTAIPDANIRLDTKMNSSQISLTTSEASTDGGHTSQPGAAAPDSATGISPVVNQPNVGPTHLSGLVCSVHRTTGNRPHALVGATTTILGDKLYVFGGRLHSRTKPQLTSDLYELDLIRRHWKKVDTQGDIPPPRYFHSVCALGDSKLVCYGGMSPRPAQANGQAAKPNAEPQPEVAVMSDIHIYDVNTTIWQRISTSDDPQGRYAHCAAILPSSAVFTSPTAPFSAIHHNPSSSDPHSGTLGVQLDGTGGAEMVVVGGQDGSNNYIEQINVFNLRSLKWTAATSWDRKCGAYKSMVVPMTGLSADMMGQGVPLDDPQLKHTGQSAGTPMLIYSNYNFLDVKLELQIRLPDGMLEEKPMVGPISPPGLRFPNGGILNNHFVVSGTYLTSSKHEYALWALDLKSLTWGRIDTNVSIFEQGSWNRGVLWNRRNTFVILGHRDRSLVDDYNHRRINFSHICMVELEAFGLYDNPRKTDPTSGYVSVSAPSIPPPLQPNPVHHAGGRPYTNTAEQLGVSALSLRELSDMELVAIGGERIPCNSQILSKRWGPFFNQLLLESSSFHDNATVISEAATLRPSLQPQMSRMSTITITPSVANGVMASNALVGQESVLDPQRSLSRSTTRTLVEVANPTIVAAASRSRSLYLPHMVQTIQLLLHFLYTSSLPPVDSALCTPHTLCSLLQMARPYQIDGLLEATVERLHEVLDRRNAAAVFNAAAMAAGGGRALGHEALPYGRVGRRESEATTVGDGAAPLAKKAAELKITTNFDKTNDQIKKGHGKSNSVDSSSTTTSTSTSTDFSHTDTESTGDGKEMSKDKEKEKTGQQETVWSGDMSSVIGLQKRGLRGLMEGRRLRERANTLGSAEEKV